MNEWKNSESYLEVQSALKNYEYAYAQMQLQQLLEGNWSTRERANIDNYLTQVNKLFINEQAVTLSLADWFERAFFDGMFFYDAFMQWVRLIIDEQCFSLSAEQTKTLLAFFLSETMLNQHKCFVLENLYLLKLDITLAFTNNKLKRVEEVRSLNLGELGIYQQKKRVMNLLKDQAMQNPSLLKIALLIWHDVYTHCFPLSINFSDQALVDGILSYTQSKLEPDYLLTEAEQTSPLMQFLVAIVE